MSRKRDRPTTALEKLSSSIINTSTVILLWFPLYVIIPSLIWQKLSLIILFLFYNLFFLFFYKNRCLGMILMWTYYRGKYSAKKHFLYDIFYTASFSTILFSIFFPFDVLLFNIFCIQFPTILITKTTLHGYLAGKITTIMR